MHFLSQSSFFLQVPSQQILPFSHFFPQLIRERKTKNSKYKATTTTRRQSHHRIYIPSAVVRVALGVNTDAITALIEWSKALMSTASAISKGSSLSNNTKTTEFLSFYGSIASTAMTRIN